MTHGDDSGNAFVGIVYALLITLAVIGAYTIARTAYLLLT